MYYFFLLFVFHVYFVTFLFYSLAISPFSSLFLISSSLSSFFFSSFLIFYSSSSCSFLFSFHIFFFNFHIFFIIIIFLIFLFLLFPAPIRFVLFYSHLFHIYFLFSLLYYHHHHHFLIASIPSSLLVTENQLINEPNITQYDYLQLKLFSFFFSLPSLL